MSVEERPRPTEFPSRFGSGDANRAAVAVLLGLSPVTPRNLLDPADRHRPAEALLATVAVLGSGIDVAYPRTNAALIDRIVDGGAVVSEYPPGTRAEPFRFPARNRIVAALSRAVVIVEGAAGSGSMITADHAIDLGLE